MNWPTGADVRRVAAVSPEPRNGLRSGSSSLSGAWVINAFGMTRNPGQNRTSPGSLSRPRAAPATTSGGTALSCPVRSGSPAGKPASLLPDRHRRGRALDRPRLARVRPRGTAGRDPLLSDGLPPGPGPRRRWYRALARAAGDVPGVGRAGRREMGRHGGPRRRGGVPKPHSGAGRRGLGGLTAPSGGAARRALPLRRSCRPLVGSGAAA